MSLVLGYITENHAIIMSDGRAGENGCVSEHYNKTLKINDNIILGFVGFLEPVEFFLNHCITQMGTNRENYYLDDFIEMIQFFFNDTETRTHLRSSFLIFGRAKDNTIHSVIAGNITDYKIEDTLVDSPRISQIGGTIQSDYLNNLYYKNLLLFFLGKADILSAMRKTISEASLADSSINSTTFTVQLDFG